MKIWKPSKHDKSEFGALLVFAVIGWAINKWMIEPDLGKQLTHFFWLIVFALVWHYNATKEKIDEGASKVLDALNEIHGPRQF